MHHVSLGRFHNNVLTVPTLETKSNDNKVHLQFKLCLLAYKAVHGLAPQYLADMCRPVSSVDASARGPRHPQDCHEVWSSLIRRRCPV